MWRFWWLALALDRQLEAGQLDGQRGISLLRATFGRISRGFESRRF
jgi:hypothetical protein